jgi:hypothetical protein
MMKAYSPSGNDRILLMLRWSLARVSMSVAKRARRLLAAMICAAGANPSLAAGDKGSPDPFPPVKLTDVVVTVLPVSGAPGNGNQCLQDAMQSALRQRGVPISDEPVQNAYAIQGEADITRKDEAWKHVVVRWAVTNLFRPEVKRSIGADIELIAADLEKEFCDKAAQVASYSVLEAAGVILRGDVQSTPGGGQDQKEEWIEREERLRSETRALFDAIWKDERPARCELDIKWDIYPIPEEDAAKWLGVHIHTNLTFAGDHVFNFQDTVAPNDMFSGAFCGDIRFAEYMRSLDRGLKERGPASLPSDPYGRHGAARTEYSFPVFNEDYTRAVLTRSHTFFYIGIGTLDGDASARLYVKEKGVWNFQERDELAAWE